MTKARDEKRIGLPLPYDPSRLVHTFWDIGMDDENCVWFYQTDGVRHRLIDFYYNSGESLPHYLQVIKEKQEQHAGGEFPRTKLSISIDAKSRKGARRLARKG
jgi:hypothetical protein